MANVVSMKGLLEAGVHFGHQARRWNPKMKPYIFTERNGIHIIDLAQTVTALNAAYQFVADTVEAGGSVLFVGTKKQAQDTISEEASRAEQYFINQRWMGGLLTNFVTIRARLRFLAELENRRERGDFERLPKKEALKYGTEIEKLERLLGGIKDMYQLPSILFVVDPRKEHIAVAEANRLGIPVVAMVDTNCDPNVIDWVIPSNDDAIRAVRLITSKIADAALEGRGRREALAAEAEQAAAEERARREEEALAEADLALVSE